MSHYVQHFLRPGDYVQTHFTCNAPIGAPCRMLCTTCYSEEREYCQCECFDEMGSSREPDMQDIGYCMIVTWLNTDDAPDEWYNGERAPVRGPNPQQITPEWNGDGYEWDYAS